MEGVNPLTQGKFTWGQVVKLFLARDISPRTKRNYEARLASFETLDSVVIDNITYDDLHPILRQMKTDYSFYTYKTGVTIARSVFRYASERLDIAMVNPLRDVDLSIPREAPVIDKRVLTVSEIDSLVQQLKPRHRLPTALMGYCGLRIGEVRGLRWMDITDTEIHIRQQRYEDGSFGSLKTRNSIRTIPLPDKVNVLIDRKVVPFNQEDTLLPMQYSYLLKREYHKVGYQISPHSLRHSFATNCVQNGLDYRTVAALLGDTVNTVMNTYSHVNDDMMDRAREIMG